MQAHKTLYLFIILVLSSLIFGGCTGCESEKDWKEQIVENSKKKRKLSDGVFQRIKVINSEGVSFEVINPEIAYSDDENSIDNESFGIRIRNDNDTETVPWDTIDSMDIIHTKKASLTARINLTNGNVLEGTLVEDSQGGLSGTTNSQPFQIRLHNIKSIYVRKR